MAGKKYQFDLEGAPTGRGTLQDPYLSISGVSSNFNFIADNDNINATNKNSQLVYTATETGTYYLGAGASDSTLTGTYTLSVREVDTATDTTAPEVSSATVSEDGTSIDIIFDEDLDASGTAPAVSAFEVTVGGGTAVNPTSVAFHTSDADTVVLAMSPAIAAGAAVTVAYDKPTSNALADAATNEVADFTAETAINRPAAPTELELEAGERQIEASWTAPSLNGGSAITGYRVEWKTAAQTWAEAATAGQSTTAAADATGHEITSLTNNTEYTVRVRAGNDAGDGPWSTEASETPVSAITQVTVEFGAASYTATEGGTAATVTVNLSADPERSVTIPITATGNGGAETSDYSLSANSVTIAGGSTSATFTVTATDDSVDDDGESVNLSFGTNLPDGVSEGTQRTATVSLTDNDGAMPVAVTVEFGAASYTAIEGQGAVTITVTLSADPERTVTIPITVPENGGADTSDYSLSANPVTINSGDTSATFTVTATDDDIYDGEGNDETLTLGFGTLPGGVETGTQNETEVSLLDNDIEWGSDLLPDDAEVGDEFRLLFVTSGEVYPTSSDIDVYNQFVQDAAAGGHADIQDYRSLFRALASTASVSALDNTATRYTSSNLGVPIWWLNGANVADDYRDFYDDSWDQGDPGSNETGSEVDFSPSGTCTNSALVWTGSNSDGEAQDNALGTSTPVAGLPCQTGGEIESGFVSDTFDYPLYGLSYVLQAARPEGPYVTDVGVHFEPEDSADDNGAYITGDTIRVAVTYSEDVVVGGTGTPTFPLQIGSTTVQAAYDADKSTADQLVFTHVVVAGEVDDNGISSGGNLLTLPSTASITAADDDTEDAYLGPLNLSTELDVNSAPRILDVEVTSTPQAASDTYGLGEDIEITVTFSQAVHLEGDVLFRFNTGNGQRQARLARGNDTKALVFAYTVKSGDEDDNGIFIAHPNHNNHPTLQLETDVPGQDDQTIVGVATGLDAEIEHASPPSSSLGNHKIDATETGADATLSALSLSGITLDPVFSADTATTSFITTSFTATTSLSSITVTATASQSGARADIDPDDADTNTAGHQVALAEGDTVISVTVTSTNGDSTRTYTVTVTRGAATDTPSTDATLSALSVTGVTLDPAFASDTYAYTASVANDVEEVTFATTENHASATVRYLKGTDELTDEDGTEDDFQVDLDVGANAITVEVTAEDGSTTQDYTVTVTRACALETGDIWCGVVNVGDITNAQGDTQRHGFQGTTGGLSDETFSLMFETGTTNNYTITAIVVGATTATSEQLYFVTSSGLTNTEVESLALHVDGESDPFVWSDSTEVITGSYRWPARTDLDWSSETTVTLRLREFPRPTVTNVEVTSTPVLETDTYGAGETIEVSVTFSEAVDATPDTDFVLSVAGVRRAPLLRGSGTATLVFGYTVVSSDDDDNGIWIGNETRTLDGNRNGEPQAGTITSVATGAAANLDHSELGTDSDHKVDGSRTTANVAPSFSSSATISVAENQTTVVTVVATDSDADDSVTGYAITGGADHGPVLHRGDLRRADLRRRRRTTRTPQDSGHQQRPTWWTVQATSGTGTREKTATQTITVTVTNVDEGQSGTVTIDDTAPMVGDELTASTANAADPDGLPDPFAPTWKWYRTPDGGSETEITGETSATYTVVAADLGATLTAKVTWTDNGGFANTLSSAPTGAVAAASALPTLSVANGSATEGSLIRFPLTLSAAPGEIVSVQCIASFETGDTAAAADLASDNSTATIQMGSTSGSCAISSAQDTIDEENETFTVTLSNPSSNAQLATDPTAKGTINDNDDPPTLSVGDLSADEGDTSISTWSFTVTLSTASGKTVTVDYATSAETGDTATSGTDFVVDNGTLTFNPGVVTRQFHVIVDGDTTVEDDETFTVTLSNPSNATISDATAKGTIENDDEAALDVLVSNYPDGSGSDFSLNFVQSGNSQRHYIAQTFTADAGFTLTAVDIPFRRVPDNSRVTVSLHALNGSKPGTYLAGLDLSGALAVGDNTFAAPAGTALAAGSYFVRVRWRSGDTNNLLMTDGPDDETSAESGWSIEDRSHYSASGSSWSNWNQQFAMRVRGTIDGVPRVATGGVRIESDPDAHDSYGVGEEIEVAVGFTDDVTVDTMSGTPRVELTVGSNTRYADYSASDSSADELAFLYEVTADDHDQDGVSIDADALELNGGAIHKDGDTSTNAVLGHAALDADFDHRVNRDPFIVSDGVSVISDPQALADTYGLGEVIEIEVEFSAAVDAATGTDFVLSVSGPKRAPLLRGSGTKKLVFGYTVVASDDDDSGIWIGEQDRTLVGNRNGDPQNGEITSAVTDRAADLDHDSPGVLSGHKVDGSRTTGNVAPSFTSSAAFDAAENQTAAGTVLAADSDADDSVTGYAITGGADQTFFSIGATSGVLTFDAAPNYEDAQDQGNNNTYVVDVTATSGMDTRVMTATQTITVTVTDVDTEAPGQPGAPAVSAASATSLRVNWSAPSNAGPAITDYDVQYRAGNSGSWSDGGHIGTATTATLTGLSEDTSYQVQVRATNDEGTGAWSDAGSGSTDAPPDNCTGDTTTTCEVDVGGSATGNIGSDREQDWFKVELEAGKRYQFDVEGADTSRGNLADPYLWGGYDSTGSSVSGLRSNDGGVGKNGRDTYTPTAAGTYYIAVADATFVGRGTYTLSVIVLGANGNSEANTDCPATTATTCRVDVGASATGNIGSNDIDWFRVDLETGKKYQFDLEGADTGRGTLGDPNLSLFDGSGIYIGVDDDSGTGLNSQIVYTATETGAHYLRATRTLTGTGTYTLSVRDVTPPPDDCTDNTATTCEVDVGGSAMGNIDSETDVDWFRIDLVSDTRYQFDLEGDDTTRGNLGDPYLQLANSLGNVLGGTQNRDSGVGDNARVIWTPANIGNELVYLIVEGAANTTGTYTLSVIVLGANGNSEADTDCPTGTTTTCQVEVGASATGNVSTDIDGDWFKAVLEADKTYQIDLEGTAGGGGTLPDPELYNIRDSSGDAIADTNNDDVGGEDGILDSRVIFTPTTAGTYYLEASSATGEHGTYTLSVREVAPPDDLPVDDCPRNTTTTCEVEVGGSVMGTIGNDLDTDWFRVELKAGRTYRIDMKGAILVAPGTLLDRELTLRLPQINTIRGRNGGQLVNTFGRDESSAHHLFRVTFHAHDDGAHYIAASGESFEKGGYKLRVIDITRDDDATPVAVTVQFGAASYTATEGGTAATVTVNLSADPGRSVTIPVTAAGADGAGSGDYTLSDTSVTIDSGETSATFIVTATDDSVDDDGESVNLSFGTLPDAVSRGALATASVSLVDDDGADTTAPTVDSATVSQDGTSIDVVFDEDLDATGSEPRGVGVRGHRRRRHCGQPGERGDQ